MTTMIKLVDARNHGINPPFGTRFATSHTGTAKHQLAIARRSVAAVYSWHQLEERFEILRSLGRSDCAFFYRHGATNYNRQNLVSGQHDTSLSDEGRSQAINLQYSLPENIDLIVCSALSRSIETMELAIPESTRLHAPILVDSRLNEVHLGILQGRRRRHLPEFDAGDLDFAPPDGESYRGAAQRVFSAVIDILSILADCGSPPRTAAIFCHAGVLRIISTMRGDSRDPRDVFKTSFENVACIEINSRTINLAGYWRKQADD